jgi:hypothetical protein
MKRLIFVIGLFLPFFSLSQIQIASKNKSFDFNIHVPGLVMTSPPSLSAGLLYGTRLIHYQVKNVEHIITIPLSKSYVPLLHFINKDGFWKFENYYKTGELEGANSYTILDSLGTIAITSTGDEGITVLGDIEVVRTIGDTLSIKKITSKKKYYADISSADLNNDGMVDIVTYGGDWPNNILQVFLQNKNGEFINTPEIVPFFYPKNWDSKLVEDIYQSGYGVGVSNLFGDKLHPQIVRVQYGSWNLNQKRYGVAFHSFNAATNSYDIIDTVKSMGMMGDPLNGGTKAYFTDLNNDGFIDFVIPAEGPNKDIYTQFFVNDGNNN